MPSSLALLLWLILLLGLLRYDPAKDSRTSLALWVPLIWMFIVGSRLPSQWLGGWTGSAAQALEEGNSLDRTIFSVLILLAIGILASRGFKWGEFFVRNLVLMAFLFFALMSFLWSDFPFVTFKRWFRDFGEYLVILVTLSDPRPLEAVRTLLRRLCFLLIPLSILIIKYYPQIGKQYEYWTGAATNVGAATSKNMLGLACLVSGIFFFWDTVTRWSDRKERRTKRIIAVNFGLIAMTLWLLNLANSATARVCLVIGCLIIAAAHSRAVRRHPAFLKVLIPACFFLYLILAYGFDINAKLAGAVGRDPTLTDRTLLWKILLSLHTNPLLGTGYQSFWLGPRLEWVWHNFEQVNEAHNGYLEVYLNLGLIGLFLLSGFLMASYRSICRRLTSHSGLAFASLSLALWTVLLFYNVTEAAFGGGLVWLTFLLGAIVTPRRAEDQVRNVTAFDSAGAPEPFRTLPLEPTGLRR
jgi:exopolysaccharide production protein ExoQ